MLNAIDFFDYVKKEHTFKILDVANQNSRKSASQKVLESIKRLCEKNKHCTVREITQSSRIAQKDGLLQILDDLLSIEKIKKEGEFYTV
jgi:3'-phosphoadenosine 5'-phosphosulfate sulfotransferase (PAPS reductase)/FAD synthetase